MLYILGGPVYTKDTLPPDWHNDVTLSYNHFHIPQEQLSYVAANFPPGTPEAYPLDTNQLSLASFPLIEDFEIRLVGTAKLGEVPSEYEARFFSPSRGFLRVHFGYLHHTSQELCKDTFTVPIGSFQTPYVDFDQGWGVLVAADDEFVYMMARNTLISGNEDYFLWFKVKRDQYCDQWKKAIQLACSKDKEP